MALENEVKKAQKDNSFGAFAFYGNQLYFDMVAYVPVFARGFSKENTIMADSTFNVIFH